MLGTLKGKKLMNRLHRGRIGSRNPDLASTGKGIDDVADISRVGRHDVRAGDGLRMDEAGDGEVPVLEPGRDVLEMGPDDRGACRVDGVTLKDDTAAIGERLEDVRGGVLIHSHPHCTAPLQLGIGGIAPAAL